MEENIRMYTRKNCVVSLFWVRQSILAQVILRDACLLCLVEVGRVGELALVIEKALTNHALIGIRIATDTLPVYGTAYPFVW